jgi:hypothetical protein
MPIFGVAAMRIGVFTICADTHRMMPDHSVAVLLTRSARSRFERVLRTR